MIGIALGEEYRMRVEEQKKLISQLPAKYPITFMEGKYDPERFYAIAKGLEKVPEGGERCFKCYRLRLEEAQHNHRPQPELKEYEDAAIPSTFPVFGDLQTAGHGYAPGSR